MSLFRRSNPALCRCTTTAIDAKDVSSPIQETNNSLSAFLGRHSRLFLRKDVGSASHLSHDPATHWTKTMTSCASVGFAENVIPERSFTVPTRGSRIRQQTLNKRHSRAQLAILVLVSHCRMNN